MGKICAVLIFAVGLAHSQPRPGEAAPTVRFGEVLQGKEAGLVAGHALLIEFWATWCMPCRENIPHLNQLVDQFQGSGIDFVSLTSEPAETVRPFLKEYPIRGTVALDRDGALANAFGAVGLPTTVLIDSKGTIAAITHPAMINAGVLKALLAHEPLPLNRMEADNRTIQHKGLAADTVVADSDATARVVIRRVSNGRGSISGESQYESNGNGLKSLLADAYGIPVLRIEMPLYLASEIYAVQAWVPPGHPETLKPLLQAALVAGASIRVRREQRQVDVLVLRGMPGRLETASAYALPRGGFQSGEISVEAATAEMVRSYIEMAVGSTVVLDAAPPGKFDVKLRWNPAHPEQFVARMRDELHLELRHERRALEFLVVDGLEAPTEPVKK